MKSISSALLVASSLIVTASIANADQFLRMVSGPSGGSWYPLGAKVMQPVSIQDARLNRINIEVKSSFVKKSGTLITKKSNIINSKIVTGISLTQNDSKVSLIGVKDIIKKITPATRTAPNAA